MAIKKDFYYKNNRLQQLRGFCYAAQYGSISKASSSMGLTHSSVSLQIKALEDDLKCSLFTRNGPKITLTADGLRLLEKALPLVNGIQNLQEEFHTETKERIKTDLRIAVNNTVKNYLMPDILKDYLASYPDIRVTLHYAEHTEAMELIRTGEVDLALLPRREQQPFAKGLEYNPIFYCRPCLITLPDHPLAGRKKLLVSEIMRYPLTLPAKEFQVIPNLHELLGQEHATGNLRVSFINAETGREYVEKGLVVTVSTDIWIKPDDVLKATPLSHLFPDVDYGMVRKSGKSIPRKMQDFLEIARHFEKKRTAKISN